MEKEDKKENTDEKKEFADLTTATITYFLLDSFVKAIIGFLTLKGMDRLWSKWFPKKNNDNDKPETE